MDVFWFAVVDYIRAPVVLRYGVLVKTALLKRKIGNLCVVAFGYKTLKSAHY